MWKEIAIGIGLPVLRSVFGWAVKALEDQKIELFELRKLCSTILRIGFISSVAYFGVNALGIEVGALGVSCGAILFDMVIKALKKNK